MFATEGEDPPPGARFRSAASARLERVDQIAFHTIDDVAHVLETGLSKQARMFMLAELAMPHGKRIRGSFPATPTGFHRVLR